MALSKNDRANLLPLLVLSLCSIALFGQAKLTPAPPRVRTDVASFRLDRQAQMGSPNQIGGGARGNKNTLILCAPGLGLSSTIRPLFIWRLPQSPTGGVRFTLLNSAGDVLFDTDVAGSRLQYPEDAPTLIQGETYSWTVSGKSLGKLPDYVHFELEKTLTREQILKEVASSQAAGDPLAQAQAFLSKGIWYDAVSILQNGIHQKPDRKDLQLQLDELYRQVIPACSNSN